MASLELMCKQGEGQYEEFVLCFSGAIGYEEQSHDMNDINTAAYSKRNRVYTYIIRKQLWLAANDTVSSFIWAGMC